jgi:hypothetical protein
MFNLTSEKWADRSGMVTSDPALVRYYAGFAAVAGKLYVHGGVNGSGASSELLNFALFAGLARTRVRACTVTCAHVCVRAHACVPRVFH